MLAPLFPLQSLACAQTDGLTHMQFREHGQPKRSHYSRYIVKDKIEPALPIILNGHYEQKFQTPLLQYCTVALPGTSEYI